MKYLIIFVSCLLLSLPVINASRGLSNGVNGGIGLYFETLC